MNERELKLNRIAQGLESIEEGLRWFDRADLETRGEIMSSLDLCIYQSHPLAKDIKEGIRISGLKETYSPCVLARKKPFNEVRRKVLDFIGLDQRRAFIMFLAIFSVADKRRRETQCKGGCTHEWHNIVGL